MKITLVSGRVLTTPIDWAVLTSIALGALKYFDVISLSSWVVFAPIGLCILWTGMVWGLGLWTGGWVE